MWDQLTNPLKSRPGTGPEPITTRESYKRLAREDHELSAEELAKRTAARRRPNADLPEVVNPWGLTPVQARIASMIVDGWENIWIAEELDISAKTVVEHVQQLKKRMGGNINRARAAVLWDRWTRSQTVIKD